MVCYLRTVLPHCIQGDCILIRFGQRSNRVFILIGITTSICFCVPARKGIAVSAVGVFGEGERTAVDHTGLCVHGTCSSPISIIGYGVGAFWKTDRTAGPDTICFVCHCTDICFRNTGIDI